MISLKNTLSGWMAVGGESAGARLPSRPAFERPLSDVTLCALLALLAIAWFAGIGTRSLISPDEGRYASLSLEMMRSGDWITPRLNGLLYFEKPPLQYWVSAIFFHLLGPTEFAARLYPALAGFLTFLLVGFTGARLGGRDVGIRSLAITASMTAIFGNSHYVTLDAGLTLFLTLALCAVLIAEHGDTPALSRRRWFWLAWAAMAGAVMSKGLVGVLIPGATLLGASLWRRDFTLWRGMHWASGSLIFLVLAAPWFVLVSMRHPGFLAFFFVHEHLARFLTTVHQREGAWWYYLPLLVAGLFPWIGGLPWLWRRSKAGGMPVVAGTDILVAWAAFIFLFFSASGSKLPSYILPLFPALALLLAFRMQDERTAVLRWLVVLPALAWTAALVASPWLGRLASPSTPIEALAPIGAGILVGAPLFLVGAAFAWWALSRRKLTLAVISLSLGHLLAISIVLQALGPFGQLGSAATLVAALNRAVDPRTPVFALRIYDQTLPFYLGRQVVLVDYQDEFAMGERAEPGISIDTIDEFVARWQALPQAAAYMDFGSFSELYQRRVPMRIIFQDHRRLLVAKS